MINPPYNEPEHGRGDGLAPTNTVPTTATPVQERTGSTTTLTPQPPMWTPDPGQNGPNGWFDFVWKLTGDHRRAAWVLAFTVLFLAAFTLVTALLAPHLGALGVLGGLGAGCAGSVALEVVRRQRDRNDPGEG